MGIGYLHSYYSSRPITDWNTCGQAAVATMLDFHGVDPFSIGKPVYDPKDERFHWRDGEVIDAIRELYPPDCLRGLCGTRPGQIAQALSHWGLDSSFLSSRDEHKQPAKNWDAVKAAVADGKPVITIMDRTRLGRKPFVAHWAVIRGIDSSGVHIANTEGIETVEEPEYLRSFECWFMPREFRRCAIFCELPRA